MAIEPLGVGKVVSDIAESSVGKALLVPAATSMGKYLGERTEAWVQRRREKRLSNIQEHVHSFERVFQKDPFETDDDKGLFDWLEGVADVDPNDAELSEIWQAALGRLAEGGARRRRLLDLAKKLSDDEAAFVHRLAGTKKLPRKWVSMSGQRALKGRLIQLGIMLPDSDSLFSVARILAFFIAAWALFLLFDVVFGYFFPRYRAWEDLLLTVSGAIAAVSFGVLQSRGYFSQDGKELLCWVRRVQQTSKASNRQAK